MSDLDNVLSAYGAAWSEPDIDKRRAFLAQAWADDGRYADPNAETIGRESLIAYISGVHDAYPGSGIELTSVADAHHGCFRFAWRLVTADGTVLVEGVDFGRVASDGRIAEIVGFFGPLAELPNA